MKYHLQHCRQQYCNMNYYLQQCREQYCHTVKENVKRSSYDIQ